MIDGGFCKPTSDDYLNLILMMMMTMVKTVTTMMTTMMMKIMVVLAMAMAIVILIIGDAIEDDDQNLFGIVMMWHIAVLYFFYLCRNPNSNERFHLVGR